jgi:restriction endonuclease S subunit
MLNLNTDILARLPILLPPVEEQELIADAIDAIDGRFEQERACAARLGKVKESLSAALLSGDLRVLPGDR